MAGSVSLALLFKSVTHPGVRPPGFTKFYDSF
jgi:hypothetical protein